MRIIGFFIFWISVATTFAEEARSIFKDKFGNGVDKEKLRQGDIQFTEIPNILLAAMNNLLSFVGYISLLTIMVGALMYIFGGVSEEMKSKGKEAIKVALIWALVSWTGWLIVNFVLDNFI